MENKDMTELVVTSNYMASFIMAKTVELPWRGQPNLICYIPYAEWLEFIQLNLPILSNRNPVNYNLALSKTGESREKLLFRYYMFDVGWSLYNEVMVSANSKYDATVILPLFDDGMVYPLSRIKEEIALISSDTLNKYYQRFISANPKCIMVSLDMLSQWNYNLFLLSVYLQSYAYGNITKINIDWRS